MSCNAEGGNRAEGLPLEADSVSSLNNSPSFIRIGLGFSNILTVPTDYFSGL